MLRPRIAATVLAVALVATGLTATTSVATAQASVAEGTSAKYHSPLTVGATTYFAGFASGKGVELFSTNGTDAGTRLVKDIDPGSDSGLALVGDDQGPMFTSLGALTVFKAQSSSDDNELWVTDGTAAGTKPLTAFATFPFAGGSNLLDLTAVGSEAYFSVQSPDKKYGRVLWKTDGTVAGTGPVAGLVGAKTGSTYPGTYPNSFVVVGSTLYFSARSATVSGREDIWAITGGTASVVVPWDATSGNRGEGPLYKYDGGIAWVADVGAGPTARFWSYGGSGAPTPLSKATVDIPFSQVVEFDGSLYYPVFGPKGDVLARLTPDASTGSVGVAAVKLTTLPISGFAVQGGKLWYTTYSASTKTETLFVASNSAEAPTKVMDLYVSSRKMFRFDSTFLGGDVYFWGNGSLWKSDGTADGTQRILNLGLSRNQTQYDQLAVAGSSVAIFLEDRLGVSSMWLSDGTTGGTFKRLKQSTFTAPLPQIIGKAIVGTTLKGFVGKWTPTGATYTYQWYRNGAPIVGATSKSYTVTAAEVATKITLSVTGRKPGFKALKKVSKATKLVPVSAG